MKLMMKKYWLLGVALLVNLYALIFYPHIGKDALTCSGKTFLNFLFMLAPIFICIGLLDEWIEKAAMIKIMGKKSGFKGVVAALCLGVVTAVPIYALLPVAGVMLKKECKLANVLIFLCSSAGIRIPLLLFEASSLGLLITLTRLALNIVYVFAIAFIIEKTLTEADKQSIYENAEKL